MTTTQQEDSMKSVLVLVSGAFLGGLAVHGLHAQARPPAFLVFETEIRDREAYEPHRVTSAREIQAAGARYLALGATPVAVEGEAPKRITLSQWPNLDAIKAWHASPAMKEANEARAKYTVTRMYAIEGKAD
jgi:uncharacterized protein (DUF1330 family)